MHFDKNGFVYILDRATGELLSAEPYVPVNWARRIDLEDRAAGGRFHQAHRRVARHGEGHLPLTRGREEPAAGGLVAGDAAASTCPPATCAWTTRRASASYLAGTPYLGAGTPYNAGPGGNLGAFIAWDPVKSARAWEIKEPYPVWSGVLTTGGGVVFYGTLDGWFKAVDAKTGALLWKFKVGSGVIGQSDQLPRTRRQAVRRGVRGHRRGLVPDLGRCPLDDPADVRAPASFMPDIARHTSQGGIVWIFGL